METLKKIVLTAAISFSASFVLKAQDNSLLQAFTNSYNYEASADYNKAIDALKSNYNESSYEINLRYGWLYYMNGKFQESINYYQKAINLMPYGIEARFGIVYPYAAMQNWEAVIKQYQEILKNAPDNTTANYRLGLIYYNREQYAEAKKYFDKYLNLFPFEYDAVIMSAWTQFKLGKLNEAKVLFNKALLLKPTDASAKEGLSYIK